MENIVSGSTATKFFLSDLCCSSDWKLHHLSLSTRGLGCSANADLQKWVMLLPVPSLDPELERAQLGCPQEGFALGIPCWEVQQRWHSCSASPAKAALVPREQSPSAPVLLSQCGCLRLFPKLFSLLLLKHDPANDSPEGSGAV